MLRGIHIVPCSQAISTVVENAAGVVRLDIYYRHVKMAALGCYVCLYIGEANFAFPQMLYDSESHQH